MKKIILDDKTKEEILRLYNEELVGSPTISERIGVNKSIVLKILKENGVNIGKSGRKFKGGKIESDKRYYQKNKDRRKEYFLEWQKKNKDKRNEYHKIWREKNIDRHRENKRNYERTRKAKDPLYKLINNFRTAIYQVLKENKIEKNGHYFEILKYSQTDLIQHLEKQFTGDITWDNYGEWHVDHIRPISSFDIKEVGDDEFMKCWSLENLQPMWGSENISKGSKVIE